VTYNLSDTLKGNASANPYIRPGDLIKLPDAEQVFVVGNVPKPIAIPLNERLTLTRAIAMSGGTLANTKKDKVRILREQPDGLTKTEIFVDLNAINNHKASDVPLQAGDIVEVPAVTGFQKVIKSLLSTIVPTLNTLPVTVVR
jgi:protein involved in polysaccharide export with SLBB domain